MKVTKKSLIIDIQEQLRLFVKQLHDLSGITLKPKAPLVLVFVLPRGLNEGLIVLPDQRNKPVHEGIVIQTYESYWKHFRIQSSSHDDYLQQVLVEPTARPGQHVLFDHYAGIPIPFLNPGGLHSSLSDHGDFRLVRDDGNRDLGSIFGVLEYEDKGTVNRMIDVFKSMMDLTRPQLRGVSRELLKHFVIVDKQKSSKTSSGTSSQEYSKARG